MDHSFENTLNADFKGHDSISFEYEIDCESPHKLTSIDCQPLFNSWKKLENIRAHWFFENHQFESSLSRKNTMISIRTTEPYRRR